MITIEEARTLYDDSDPVHDFDHILRVTHMAEHLARLEGADQGIVKTAALLHDISRTEPGETEYTDHALEAADAARDLLRKKGADEAFIEAVAHAISAHRFRNEIDPETIEAKVLFDADKLDAIGAVGIARAFAYSGRAGNPLYRPVEENYQQKKGEVHTAHHEYRFKLSKIKDRMTTESGRQIAEARTQFMDLFFEKIALEVEGKA